MITNKKDKKKMKKTRRERKMKLITFLAQEERMDIKKKSKKTEERMRKI